MSLLIKEEPVNLVIPYLGKLFPHTLRILAYASQKIVLIIFWIAYVDLSILASKLAEVISVCIFWKVLTGYKYS